MNKSYDFTQGNITKQMVYFSLPIFLTNLLQTSYQFIDSIWVGNLLGSNALGAISIAAPVIFTVLSFIIGVNSATLTVLSQRKGASDKEGLVESLNAFVVALTILSVAFGIIGFLFTDPILKFLGTPDEIFESTKVYLRINFLGILFLFGYNFIGTVLRALGDSKTPIRFVLFAVILNTALDPLFIAYFNWGIEGAAYATIISQGSAFLYGVVYSIWKSKIPFTVPHLPDMKELKRISKLGIPAGLQMMTVSAGVTAIMGIVASFGTQVVAGFGAAQRLDRIIMLPAFTLGAAVNSMAGQNIGSGKWQRVSAISKNGIILILAVSFTISAIIFLSAESMIRLFIDDPKTIAFGENYLKTVAFFYPFLGINFVLNGVVKAAGAMVQVLILNIISFWVLRVPLTYVFSNWLGAKGIAYGIGVSFIISSVFAIGYYRYGKWRDIELFDQQKEEDSSQYESSTHRKA
ncbi:MATE family efflux transporter [Guptibacillus hwajinpoensis]|uniref:MATE family efflux transporter n=1 Tax=Guptibacillus hwajinpoensis TaxID=208199 RepID=UPI001CFED698|nr:MATE family efflux transporter [Pseudalkalibacillus hwajinpoensis]WLR58371.1 MATE family efflux transporter [Pseudalkalibacillus hwajinpoensis]